MSTYMKLVFCVIRFALHNKKICTYHYVMMIFVINHHQHHDLTDYFKLYYLVKNIRGLEIRMILYLR